LAYIDSRDVVNRLDEVCGPENWSDTYPHIGSTTVCQISISIDGQWVAKTDGAGATDVEAEKGQLSDAFKRCAVKWGIGRYLYDIPTPWVQIDEFKHILPVEMECLARLLPNATPGLTVHGLSGLSKQPAKFWSNAHLALVAPAKYGDKPDEAKAWLIENFRAAIDKAPSRELLAKLQMDNAAWIDKLEPAITHQLYEACSIRAMQFDSEAA
jgi:hypothetical protein